MAVGAKVSDPVLDVPIVRVQDMLDYHGEIRALLCNPEEGGVYLRGGDEVATATHRGLIEQMLRRDVSVSKVEKQGMVFIILTII